MKETQVQVQAAELLIREKHQLATLIDMVAKQAVVIERLQAQLELEEQFKVRYLTVQEDAAQSRDDTAVSNTFALDQLRHQVETELSALSAIHSQLNDAVSSIRIAQDRQLAGASRTLISHAFAGLAVL